MSTTHPQTQLPADLADVRRMLDKLAVEGRVDELIELVVALLVQMRDKNNALTARLGSALRQLYGRKSEKISTEQLMLLFAKLGDDLPPGAAAAAGAPPETGATPAPDQSAIVPQPAEPAKPLQPARRARGGRGPLPLHLPRESRVVSVLEPERTCAQCGAEKECIGHCVSEILEFVPGQLRVIEERREKLACKRCPEEGVATAPSENDARAAVVVGYFKGIYRVEAACKDEGLSPEERYTRRQGVSFPIVDEMYRWIHEMHSSAVPNTSVYKATLYAVNQEKAWRRCFTDGRFEIDNGEVERQIRRIAVGRKNYLFAGSEKGAERLAVGYTVFGSCRMHDVNSFEWATDVISKLQAGWPRSRLDELVPDIWAKRRLEDTAATIAAVS